jgi:hypothetical protein
MESNSLCISRVKEIMDFVSKMYFLLYIIAMSNMKERACRCAVATGNIWGLGLKTRKKCT